MFVPGAAWGHAPHLRVRRASDDWEPNMMIRKRDFQEINPARTSAEFYARYDPSVGAGTAMGLGAFLFLILFKTIVRWIWHQINRNPYFRRLARKAPLVDDEFLMSESGSQPRGASFSISDPLAPRHAARRNTTVATPLPRKQAADISLSVGEALPVKEAPSENNNEIGLSPKLQTTATIELRPLISESAAFGSLGELRQPLVHHSLRQPPPYRHSVVKSPRPLGRDNESPL